MMIIMVAMGAKHRGKNAEDHLADEDIDVTEV
jgi:hypothetical protein